MRHSPGKTAGVDVAEDGGRLASNQDGGHPRPRYDTGVGGGISDAGGWGHRGLLSRSKNSQLILTGRPLTVVGLAGEPTAVVAAPMTVTFGAAIEIWALATRLMFG